MPHSSEQNQLKLSSHKFVILLAIIFAIPRVFRISYPFVWLEDPFYLYAADLIKHGNLPFRDFAHTQFPGADYLLSFFYFLFGTSYHVAEILTAGLVYATTWLICLIGIRIHSFFTGVAAGIIFSFSSLLFRYHVWEREILVLFLITLLFYLFIKWDKLSSKRNCLVGFILACGISLKLTTVVPVAAVLSYVITVEKRFKPVFQIALSTFTFTAIFLLLFALPSFNDFLNQAFFYHFIKGHTSSSRISFLLFPFNVLDITLSFGIMGFVFLKKVQFPHILYPIYVTLFEYVFFSFISSNIWPHNLIPWLLLLSLTGGIFFQEMNSLLKEKKFKLFSLHLGILLTLLLFTIPIKNSQWVKNSVYGLGYISRADISELGKYLREHTNKEDSLLIPQYVAGEINRKTIISGRIEAEGVLRWLEEQQKSNTLQEILNVSNEKNFIEMQALSAQAGWSHVLDLLQKKQVKYVVIDVVPGEKIPFTFQHLWQFGYRPVKSFGEYLVWEN